VPELLIVIRLRECGSADEGFEAGLADYAVLVESGRTPWEAVHRLVAGHRALLELRWTEEALSR
jgi:hypothetical protein